MRRPQDLSTPRRGIRVGIHYDPEAFGRFSESIARFLGTARFLVAQTIIVVVWIFINATIPGLRFDEYPFILLTLALSLQASYAAPLILLAQNRQEARDREEAERDRAQAARALADTEFLARELASIRLALADVATNADLDRVLEQVDKALDNRLADDGQR
ncbi:MAG TPA: DUF1003 domain-containing protein [Acidimicrobiales bacterium]|nr:DUF1003 domain-containing protein [Acidimicrobiales bacterium]